MAAETRETTVELPADVYERLGGDDGAVAETLADLASDHALLQESIDTYTGRDGDDGAPDLSQTARTPPPIARLIGFETESVEEGEVVMTLEPGPQHANPMGTMHGGVLCDLGDAAMGYAYASTLGPDESFTTLELDVKFRRPVWDQPLTATGRVVDGGRTVGLVECDVTGPEGELVARLESVCLTLRGDQASGR